MKTLKNKIKCLYLICCSDKICKDINKAYWGKLWPRLSLSFRPSNTLICCNSLYSLLSCNGNATPFTLSSPLINMSGLIVSNTKEMIA